MMFVAALLLSISPVTVVCIDPGHPSEVGMGARGRKLTEVGVAWQMATVLKQKLEATGVKVVLTKSREREFVSNRARAAVAEKAEANLFLRLHCDSRPDRGFAVYFPDRTGKSQGVTGPSENIRKRSRIAAGALHAALKSQLGGILPDRGLQGDDKTEVGSKQGALTGSVFSKTPVVLVEMLVITNRKDEVLAASKKGRERLAQALCDGTMAALRDLRKAELDDKSETRKGRKEP